eukprot:546690-Prorocentrum_minimum.AAC.3
MGKREASGASGVWPIMTLRYARLRGEDPPEDYNKHTARTLRKMLKSIICSPKNICGQAAASRELAAKMPNSGDPTVLAAMHQTVTSH